MKFIWVDDPHPATIDPEQLLRACEVTFGRASGPGGQHRNRVATAAQVVHEATGVYGQASERRSQNENRHVAIRRLREKLARKVRTKVPCKGYVPSALWTQRRAGRGMSVNPGHRDYPSLLAEALDVLVAWRWDVGRAAGALGLSMSQLARLVRHDRHAFALLNEGRAERGFSPLR